MGNEDQIAFWNGEAASRWVTHQEALDQRIRPFGEAALEAAGVAPGMRVLDVGCGCGDTTLEVARRVGERGRVLGVDVSGPMLARARERAAGRANVAFVEADAATLGDGGPFDAAVSRFGVMFFEDPTAAFANVRRLLAPGARLSFACWQGLAENPWATIPLTAVARAIGIAPPTESEAPGPFAFASAERVLGILRAAGLREPATEPAVHGIPFGATLDEAVEYAATMGPASRMLREAEAGGMQDARARAERALQQELAALAPGFTLKGAAWIVTARAP